MRAIWITKFGGPEVLQVRESPDPTPGKGQVRIRVKAAGLNFAEMMARQGLYPDAPKAPCVVGYEVSGVIDALGEGVTAPAVGTRVIALTHFGGHADTVIVSAANAIPMPDEMSFEEGAALPVVYLTAFHMLFRVGQVRPGMRVLVHMAAGGVGLAALQLCQTVANVEVFGTASASKHSVIREHGCTHPIDYRSMDWEAEVKRLTGGRGVDLILDALGGEDWKKGFRSLAPAGMHISFGVANMAAGETRSILRVAQTLLKLPRWTPLALMDKNRAVAGVNMGHLWDETEMLMGEMNELLALYRQKKIKPVIDSTFPFDKAADAHRRMQDRKNIGKIVLVP